MEIASSAEAAVLTSNPACSRLKARLRRKRSSSSTTSIDALRFFFPYKQDIMKTYPPLFQAIHFSLKKFIAIFYCFFHNSDYFVEFF
jgi:hypothetical protein